MIVKCAGNKGLYALIVLALVCCLINCQNNLLPSIPEQLSVHLPSISKTNVRLSGFSKLKNSGVIEHILFV